MHAGQDPWADTVIGFDRGMDPVDGYDDPQTTLGSPERYTGEASFAGVVSIFNPPFGDDELFSLGTGGHLTVAFDEPVVNDPAHAFGIDLIVFGNGGFIDSQFPDGVIGSPPGLFGTDPMRVSVSENGTDFVSLGDFTEGFFPTQGYRDADPFDPDPGDVPTDFTRPVDPALTVSDFDGLTLAQALDLYDGSGGGTPIDIAASGLDEIRFVRVEATEPGVNVEIDGFAAVPEPATLLLSVLGCSVALRRK